jgi:hypothetical protein
MRKYVKSNVPKGETRQAILQFTVEGGANWAICHRRLSAKWIEGIENMLEKLSKEAEGEV